MRLIRTNTKIDCDNCRKEMEFNTVELSFGYPSRFDGHRFDFCSDKCLKGWMTKNIK